MPGSRLYSSLPETALPMIPHLAGGDSIALSLLTIKNGISAKSKGILLKVLQLTSQRRFRRAFPIQC